MSDVPGDHADNAPNHAFPSGFTALPAGTRVDRYEIESLIAAGGFGVTYMARHVGLNKRVALKEHFPRDFARRDGRSLSVEPTNPATFEWTKERFLKEGEALTTCRHPGVVEVSDVFEANGTAYMALGYEDGYSFGGWLKSLGRVAGGGQPRWATQAELDAILKPLLAALAYVHSKDMLHRDLAPDNIIIRLDGTPVLIDFGAARQAIAQRSQIMSAIVKGGYSPPEQYTTSGKAQGPWSDIYALGATLHYALTAQQPDESTTRTVDDSYRPLRETLGTRRGDYAPEFLAAIDRALMIPRVDRPQTVVEWQQGLLDTRGTLAVNEANVATELVAPLREAQFSGVGEVQRRDRFARYLAENNNAAPHARASSAPHPHSAAAPHPSPLPAEGTRRGFVRKDFVAGGLGALAIGGMVMAGAFSSTPQPRPSDRKLVQPQPLVQQKSTPSVPASVVVSPPSPPPPVEDPARAQEAKRQLDIAAATQDPAQCERLVESDCKTLKTCRWILPTVFIEGRPVFPPRCGSLTARSGGGTFPPKAEPKKVEVPPAATGAGLLASRKLYDDLKLNEVAPHTRSVVLQNGRGALIACAKPFVTTNDLSGRKVRVPGGASGEAIKAALEQSGAITVVMASAEIYSALSVNVIDCAVFAVAQQAEASGVQKAALGMGTLAIDDDDKTDAAKSVVPGSGKHFADCPTCPQMVVAPAGRFMMGSPVSETGRFDWEGPQRDVTIAKAFAVGQFSVTVGEFSAFVNATNHSVGNTCAVSSGDVFKDIENRTWVAPGFPQTDKHPVVCVNFDDALAYLAWLNRETGQTYRLLADAEREYVARAGTKSMAWWGSGASRARANFSPTGASPVSGTVAVQSFAPNPWGLYQVYGNSGDWVQDCWAPSLQGAPSDGSALLTGDCVRRAMRGGSFIDNERAIRSALRASASRSRRFNMLGFRVARDVAP